MGGDVTGMGKCKLTEQPMGIIYSICDDSIVKAAMEDCIAKRKDGAAGVEICKNIYKDIERETKPSGPAKKADTLEELAAQIGIPVEAFMASVRQFSEECAANGKLTISKAPFYAIWQGRFQENTMGGVVNDAEIRVIGQSGESIPGLFAVGDCCRGDQFKDGKDGMTISKIVSNLTWAVTSGYLAGEKAAEYINTDK